MLCELNGQIYAQVHRAYEFIQLGLDYVADELTGSSDWVAQSNSKAMMGTIRHFKATYRTASDRFDTAQIERMSKVFLRTSY